MKQISKMVLCALCISSILFFTGCQNKLLGKVGDLEVKPYEFKYFLGYVRMQIESEEQVEDPATYWKVIANKNKARDRAFEELTKHKIIMNEVKKSSYKLSASEDKKIKDSMESQISSTEGGATAFAKELEKSMQGVTIEEFKDINYNIYVEFYVASEAEKINVSG